MANQNSHIPASNHEANIANPTRDPTYIFPPQVVHGIVPPTAPPTFQPVNGGLYPPGFPYYAYLTPSSSPFPQRPTVPTISPETNDNATRHQDERESNDSSPKHFVAQAPTEQATLPKVKGPGDTLTEFMSTMRRHIRSLDGAQIRGVILSICLEFPHIHKTVATYVKQKEAEDQIVIAHSSDGLGLHLQYWRIGELETLLTRICEHESSSTRDRAKHLILAIEEQKQVERTKLF
ncbi:hypothetical protein F5Y13DRAFT_204452 [Hypoxylon sp. FL1857]|nr:hypothetical protein F5Y13DRAFT_204452 [Hypoxylon sp. FL1857]